MSDRTGGDVGDTAPMCCIIFVERRVTALLLSEVINTVFSSRSKYPTRASCIVGQKQNISLGPDKSFISVEPCEEDVKRTTNVLSLFREGKIQILVATSVLEVVRNYK